jgi:pimeloyl-ACP methyl ester carboxylesterase
VAAQCPSVKRIACESTFSATGLMLHYTLRWSSLYLPDRIMKLFPVWHLRATMRVVQWISQVRRRCRYTNLESWLPRLRTRPVLLIAGEADTYVAPAISRDLCRRMQPACNGVWVVPDAKHNMARQVAPDSYDRMLASFFAAPAGATPIEIGLGQPQDASKAPCL